MELLRNSVTENSRGKLLYLIVILVLAGCGVSRTWHSKSEREWRDNKDPEEASLKHSVYLFGDAGNPSLNGPNPTFDLLGNKLRADSLNSNGLSARHQTVLFLGDNVYENGLPPEDAFDRKVSEQKLAMQIDIVKGHAGKRIFVPGNHDWNHVKPDGWEYVVRQQEFVEQYLQDSSAFFPKGGCPGPVEIELTDNLVLIILDSNWWLTRHYRPDGTLSTCGVENEFDLLVQFQNVLRRHRDKHKLVAIHHPLYSNGNHGGYFSLFDYVFPLTLRWDYLYVPLPVIGSIYPLMRKYGVSRQDIPNPVYQKLKRGIMNIVNDEENVVLVSGHDHNLQLHKTNEVHHIISGSASKEKYVIKGNNAVFVSRHKGLAKLNYFDNGEVWVEFWAPGDENKEGRLLFKKPLYAIAPAENPQVAESEVPDYRDSTIVKAAGREYRTSSFIKKKLMGTAYRQEWGTPVKLQYLDMKTDAGGITPLQRGGGSQTISLRAKGEDGNEYVLRSVNKDPAAVLPEGLQKTFAEDIVQDQMSSSHPYGALVVPKLASALGVYHTSPRVVYIPFTPQLGPFLNEFGGMVALMEVRPDEDLSEFKNFGRSRNVVSTSTMFRKMQEDNDDVVDAESFLKARMLDMLMNDWDRHEDQWRWAEFEDEDGHHLFKPVPRDRDQVFAKFNGLIPSVIASKLFERRLTNFDHEVDDVVGLNLQALHLDRRLLFGLEKDIWEKTAKEVQHNLSDEVIRAAVKDLPPEVYDLSGEEIEAKLKSRRDALHRFTLDYYDVLAEKVDVTFSDKYEYVLVEREENGNTRVRAWKRDLEPDEPEKIEQKLFDRTFRFGETEEIRIYCMAGKDSVLVTGQAAKGIKVRVVGGPGEDYIRDNSRVTGLTDKTEIYDFENSLEENVIEAGNETDVHTSDRIWVNIYDPNGFQYDQTKPKLHLGYDVDYGLSAGASVRFLKQGFRTFPYATMHRIAAMHSFGTRGFRFEAEGDYPLLFGRQTGLNVGAAIDGPGYVINYFGEGNEAEYNRTIGDYRVGLNNYRGSLTFTHRLGSLLKFSAGPLAEYAEVREKGEGVEDQNIAEEYLLAGGLVELNLDLTNDQQAPTRGMKWENQFSLRRSINNLSQSFGQLTTDARFYLTPNWTFKVTMVYRAGVEANFGDYPFYHSAFLGGNTNLRGFRMNRFAGRTAFFQSIEVRPSFGRMQNYLVTGEWGVFGFVDNGRIWTLGEISDQWHNGYGGGLWIRFYDLFILTGGVGFSNEGSYFRLDSGFFF